MGQTVTSEADNMDAAKAEVAALYSLVAPTYGTVGPAVFAHFGRRLVELVGISTGARVLDVAAGRGAILFAAAEKAGASGHVTGIDLAGKMVQETAADIERQGLMQTTMLHMDAEHLAFPGASFDYVLCGFAIFFFPDLERALSEFYRVLRPGGRVGATFGRYRDELVRWYEELLVSYHNRYQFQVSPSVGRSRDLEEIKSLLSGTGFIDVRDTYEETEFIYANEEEWWAARWTHGPRFSLERMPPDVLHKFKAEVFSGFERFKESDGFHELWGTWYVMGIKG
jgi:ubiquinone/menaquinone biosynthesis C-methylase UbiE